MARSSVRLPSAPTSARLLTRPSAMLRRNGGVIDAGIAAGLDGPVLRDSARATCSSLIATPLLKYCSGDQLMSTLSSVSTLDSSRYTMRPICMRPYSEPLTPVTTIWPPLERATWATICCSVVSRPSSQTAPPSTASVTPPPISVRRSHLRRVAGGASAGGGLRGVSIRT